MSAAFSDTLPPVAAVTAAVLVAQQTVGTVAERLLAALSEPRSSGQVSADQVVPLRARLEQAIRRRGRTTIVIDGLDEAIDPELSLRGHLIYLWASMSDLCRSFRQVWVDSPVRTRLIMLVIAQWVIVRERCGRVS